MLKAKANLQDMSSKLLLGALEARPSDAKDEEQWDPTPFKMATMLRSIITRHKEISTKKKGKSKQVRSQHKDQNNKLNDNSKTTYQSCRSLKDSIGGGRWSYDSRKVIVEVACGFSIGVNPKVLSLSLLIKSKG